MLYRKIWTRIELLHIIKNYNILLNKSNYLTISEVNILLQEQ